MAAERLSMRKVKEALRLHAEGRSRRSIGQSLGVGHSTVSEPDIQTTASGVKVAHLSLATSRRIPRDGGFEELTEWHRLTLWDRLAELAEEYIRKGDRLCVEGRMEYDSFERNGVTVPTAEVVVRELVLLGAPSNSASISEDDEAA